MMHASTLYITLVLATLHVVCSTEENSAHHKRAPLGFTGVRGKKSIPDSAYSDSDTTLNISHGGEGGEDPAELSPSSNSAVVAIGDGGIVKRAPSGFMGMRGKKPYPAAIWEGTYPDAQFKRAPSGFMGMRGKKDLEFTNYGQDYVKRVPSGFMGMRGKKEYDDFDNNVDTYFDKRSPMGFMGMRGKKDYDESSSIYSEDKRAPSSSFFGMRGKKQPSGFFGMRGKKYPYEFRGKFVGVRGKKLSNEITAPEYYRSDLYNEQLARLAHNLDLNQLMLLLTENNDGSGVWNREFVNEQLDHQ